MVVALVALPCIIVLLPLAEKKMGKTKHRCHQLYLGEKKKTN